MYVLGTARCLFSLIAYESNIGTKKINLFLFADGDLGYYGNAETAYFKQKHRLVWERRHGKVGSGRKDVNKNEEEQQ